MNTYKKATTLLIGILVSVMFIAQASCQEAGPPTSTLENASQTLQAFVDGKNVTLKIKGNVSATQISDLYFQTLEDWYNNSNIDFTINRLNSTAGFVNMTIPKSAFLGGTEPVVAANGARPENQGFTQDKENFYVWFTMLPEWDNCNRSYIGISFLLVSHHEPTEPTAAFWAPLGLAGALIAVATILVIARYKCIHSRTASKWCAK